MYVWSFNWLPVSTIGASFTSIKRAQGRHSLPNQNSFTLKVFGNDENLFPEWWLEWLTAELLLGFWRRVSIVCRYTITFGLTFDRNELFFSVWLFGVLPFSFLLVEADGFSFGPQTGIRARLYEALVIFLLVFLLVIFLFCLIVSTITNISSQILFQCSNVPVVY